MTELAIRLVFSLAVVVGLLLLLGRVAGKRFQAKTGALVQVVHRQQLSRGTGVAVVTVGERVLVLGTTEQQITLLTELDELPVTVQPAETVVAPIEPLAGSSTEAVAEPGAEPAATFEQSLESSLQAGRHADPLAGSVLSAETWRQALKVARGSMRRAS